MLKLKLDEQGHVVVRNGFPVFVDDKDGKDVEFDANGAVEKIKSVSNERDKLRGDMKSAGEKLSVFDGLDPEEARKALELAKNLDAKKLIDAGEVEKVKESIAKAYESQTGELRKSFEKKLGELSKSVETKDEQIFRLMVTNRFTASKFVQEALTVPPDFAESRFGRCFKVEDGKVVAYDANGKQIYSRKRPGEIADFDEALEVLVDEYPDKARILKGSGASGSGKTPGSGGSGSAVTLTREQAKNPQLYQQAKEAAAKAGTTLQIAD